MHNLFKLFESAGGSIIPNPADSNNQIINGIINLGLPILIFLFLGFTSIYYIRLIQRGRVDLKETITWIIWNVILLILSIYLIFVYILAYFGISAFNVIDWVATYLGISQNTQQWIICLILFFIGFLYAKSFNHTIRISKLKQQIDVLARELAILKGRFESTIDLGPLSSIDLPDPENYKPPQFSTDLMNTIEKKEQKKEDE